MTISVSSALAHSLTSRKRAHLTAIMSSLVVVHADMVHHVQVASLDGLSAEDNQDTVPHGDMANLVVDVCVYLRSMSHIQQTQCMCPGCFWMLHMMVECACLCCIVSLKLCEWIPSGHVHGL